MPVSQSDSFGLDVQMELLRARAKFPRPHQSRHEGYAVLLEEVMEVQETVFKDRPAKELRAELIQVAAMAQRMAEDMLVCPRQQSVTRDKPAEPHPLNQIAGASSLGCIL